MECIDHQSDDNIGSDATRIIELLYLDKDFSIKIEDLNVIKIIRSYIEAYFDIHFSEKIKADSLLKKLNII